MNRLQNSIVRFLKYVIELENLIILLNIGSLSFLKVSFIAGPYLFSLCRRVSGGRVQQEAIESWTNERNLKLLLLLLLFSTNIRGVSKRFEHCRYNFLTT